MRARMRPVVLALVTTLAFGGTVALAVPASAAPVDPDQLQVTVAGDSAVKSTTAAPVSIVGYGADGSVGTTIALPTAAIGADQPFTLNADEPQQGILEQSADHTHVVLAGYAAVPGTTKLNGTAAPATQRVVASIDANGAVDTSTTLGSAFSGSHIRGVASTDGTHFWVGGKGDGATPYGGLVYATEGASASSVVVGSGGTTAGDADNGRVPVIADGQLYLGSDRSSVAGITRVGTGAPIAPATETVVAAQPSDGSASTAQGYVFAGGALYVAYTEGTTPGIVKYVGSGTNWTAVGTYPGEFWGLTGRVAGGGVVLYATSGSGFGNRLVELYDSTPASAPSISAATIATAASDREFRGVAFAAGFTPGTGAVPVPGAVPTFSWAASATGGTGAGLAGVVGAADDPAATVTVTDPDGSAITALTATGSSDPAVAATADVRVTGGTGGAYSVAVTPRTAGSTTLTFTATTADGRTATSTLTYGALAAARSGDELHLGVSDASAAVSVGDGYFLVGDDDSTPIRLYGPSGYQVRSFDFASQVGIIQAGESWDLESVAVQGDTAYWLGSLGPSRSGNAKPDRDTIVETKIVGSGAATSLQYVASAHGITAALVAWDEAGAGGLGVDHYGFGEALTDGEGVSSDHSLNVEGSAFAPDGTTLWLGFRSPLVPPGARADALVIGVTNIQQVLAGTETPRIGQAFDLDLGGRAIRDVKRAGDGNYLISAGGADDSGTWALYGWDGVPTDAPVRASTVLDGRGLAGGWEGIIDLPSLADGSTTTILQDDGTVDLYGDGTEAEDLDQDLKAFSSSSLTLDFDGAFDAARTGAPGAGAPGTDGTGAAGAAGAGAPGTGGAGTTGAAGTGTSADGAGEAARVGDPASALAFTGTDGGLLAGGAAFGLLLLASGVGIVIVRRRRPSTR